jgi:FMN phosphatase YigB (HAD superfamily)
MEKKRLFVDLDDTLVDFQSGIDKVDPKTREHFTSLWREAYKDGKEEWDEVPGIFALMDPMPGGIEASRLSRCWYALLPATKESREGFRLWIDPSCRRRGRLVRQNRKH